MLLRDVLWPAVLLPLLVAGSLVWLDPRVRRLEPGGRDGARERRSPWGPAAAFALAYLAAHAALAGWPPLPAVESSDWLAWLVVAAAIGGAVVHGLGLRLADPVLAALLFLGISATTLRPMLEHTWDRTEGAIALGLLAGAWSIAWLATSRLLAAQNAAVGAGDAAARALGALVPGAVLGIAGVALALSATARLGMTAGAAATALAALTAAALAARGRAIPGHAAAPPAVTALVGLAANGVLYAELHPAAAAALLAAPLAALVGFRWVSRDGWRRTAAAVLAATLVASAALGVAVWQRGQVDSDPVEEYDPYA